MTRTEFAAACARKTALRVATICTAAGGAMFLLVSTDPFFARFDPLGLWLARIAAVVSSGLAFFFGVAHDNCPACGRPRGLGLILMALFKPKGGPPLRHKPCDLEKAASNP